MKNRIFSFFRNPYVDVIKVNVDLISRQIFAIIVTYLFIYKKNTKILNCVLKGSRNSSLTFKKLMK